MGNPGSRHVQANSSGAIAQLAGAGYGILVVPGGDAGNIPGAFPVTLKLIFPDSEEVFDLEAPRAIVKPQKFLRAELSGATASGGYTVYLADDVGTIFGPAQRTRRTVNVAAEGTAVPSAAPVGAVGQVLHAGIGGVTGFLAGTGTADEYIRLPDGTWKATGTTYVPGDRIAYDNSGEAIGYYLRGTSGSPTNNLSLLAEIG